MILRFGWAALPLASFLQCSTESYTRNDSRGAVEVMLPDGGMTLGNPRSSAIVVEFGTYACNYCREFHEAVMPVLYGEYIEQGRLRFRYVEMAPFPSLRRLASIAECLSSVNGVLAAQTWAFDEAERMASISHALPDSTVSQAAELASWSSQQMRACADSTATHQKKEAEAARRLGVVRTPTFVIGVELPQRAIIGWPVVGLVPNRIRETVDEVTSRFGKSMVGADPSGR